MQFIPPPYPGTRIVFMGTSSFAIPSLEILIAHGYAVVAVVTVPDKPRGRGRRTTSSPIKEVACAYGIPVLQPTNLQASSFLAELANYQATIQVVVAFRILPKVVWAMPALGTFNLHASLLPAYRGAAPINWAIINGEQKTGLTTFLLAQGVDTGHILFQEEEPIAPHDTAGILHDRLKHKGSKLVLKTVRALETKCYTAVPQTPTPIILSKVAPKIYKRDCQIDWSQASVVILNFIRGLSPYPAAWTVLNGSTYKILHAEEAYGLLLPALAPGRFHSDGKKYVCVGTNDTPIAIRLWQLAGGRPMDITEFLRGHTV